MQRSSRFQTKVGQETTCSVIFSPQMYVLPLAKGKAFQLAVKCSVGSRFAALEHIASDMTGRRPRHNTTKQSTALQQSDAGFPSPATNDCHSG